MKMITTFPDKLEFEKALKYFNNFNISHEILDPSPAYSFVGIPSIILEEELYKDILTKNSFEFICSGWIEYRSNKPVPQTQALSFNDDIFGSFRINFIAPCIADFSRIRIYCNLSGDISCVFPYLNSVMLNGMYMKDENLFSYMDSYHMISLNSNKITIAKADDIVDVWYILEKIRTALNDTWKKRSSIEPSYEVRKRPPALEIYKRLPGISCGQCGEKTCMAFALRLWGGEVQPELCKPIYDGEYYHLKEAYLDICAATGIKEDR
jgi:ArsR family metal-binding transcriptional regulator